MRRTGLVLAGLLIGAAPAGAQTLDPTGEPGRAVVRRDTTMRLDSPPEAALQATYWGDPDEEPASIRRSLGLSVRASHLLQPHATYQADSLGFGATVTGELWGSNGLGLRLELGGDLHFGDAFGPAFTTANGDGTETDATPTYAVRQRYLVGVAVELSPWQLLLPNEPTVLSPYIALGGGVMHLREGVDVDLDTYRGDDFVRTTFGTRRATLTSPYLSVGLGAATHSDGAKIGDWTLPIGVRLELSYARALRPAHAGTPGLYLSSGHHPDELTLTLGLQLAL